MGYYVRGQSYNFRIKAGQDKAIMDALRELNTHDELKHGGSYSGGSKKEAWFSWMNEFDWSQDNVVEFLKAAGFEVTLDENDDIINLSYDSKTGQEDLYLTVMAPFIEDGSSIEWCGEDDQQWRWSFEGGKMYNQVGERHWNDMKEEITLPY